MKDATLSIGDDVGMSNTCIHCHKSITIEKGTKIGAGCLIVDTDFHSLHWEDRADHTDIEKRQCKPVYIGAYAFIGTNSIILKGVNIGEKAIIGAGSVVSRDIPSGLEYGDIVFAATETNGCAIVVLHSFALLIFPFANEEL